MKVIDCVQGSDEWWAYHTGRPSISNLSRILTPSRLEYSKAARGYASEVIAERILGAPLAQVEGSADTIWTERGLAVEEFARNWYSFHRDVEVTQIGCILNDAETVVGSPDGLVGDDGIIEIKCYGAAHHARIMTGADAEIANRLQTQGYLWLTGRKWIDVVAFNPDLPKKITRQLPDPEVQEMIGKQLERFFREMERAERKLAELGDVIEESEDLQWDLNESLAEAGAA